MKDDKIPVLLVEDDVDLGQMLKLYLEMDRFAVSISNSAEEALSLFSSHSFSIGILDVNLPEMDGFDLAEHIRKINPTFPFIFLTSRTFKEDKIKGLKLGADDYITKPFDAEELVLRMYNILNRVGEKSQLNIKLMALANQFDKVLDSNSFHAHKD